VAITAGSGVFVNLVVYLSYALINPRIRLS